MGIRELKTKIIFENKYVRIEISKKDASVIAVTDVRSGDSIMGESVRFFELFKRNENDGVKVKLDACESGIGRDNGEKAVHEEAEITALEYSDGIITVVTEIGKVDVKAEVFDDCMVLEVKKALPKEAFSFVFGNVKFEYDTTDPETLRATDVAMTVNTNQGRVLRASGRCKGRKARYCYRSRNVLKRCS